VARERVVILLATLLGKGQPPAIPSRRRRRLYAPQQGSSLGHSHGVEGNESFGLVTLGGFAVALVRAHHGVTTNLRTGKS
jgi:hypothetical protein